MSIELAAILYRCASLASYRSSRISILLGFGIAFWLSWVRLTFAWCTGFDVTLIYGTESAEASIFSCNNARGLPEVFFAKYLQNAGFREIRGEHDEVFASRVTGRWDDEALEAGKEAGATDRLRPGFFVGELNRAPVFDDEIFCFETNFPQDRWNCNIEHLLQFDPRARSCAWTDVRDRESVME